ncbi:hypothetical protein D3C85_540350 [compost metagenome]
MTSFRGTWHKNVISIFNPSYVIREKDANGKQHKSFRQDISSVANMLTSFDRLIEATGDM